MFRSSVWTSRFQKTMWQKLLKFAIESKHDSCGTSRFLPGTAILLLDANSSQNSECKFQHLFSMLTLGPQKERVYSPFHPFLPFDFFRVHPFRAELLAFTVDLMLPISLCIDFPNKQMARIANREVLDLSTRGSCAHAFVFYLAMWTTDIVTKCQASKQL